ncbi:MAG TPA: dephospho-CoA kinase [Alphaproteobacteria bacterium]|nr:dephospho-CoA kinase [Alphaproteobacteria bacterium]
MIVIGLTGSIGMGKSTVARMMEKLGCAIHDSDKAVHEALSPTGEAFEEVAVTFPACWEKKTHTINKKILADIIFNDPAKKQELEDILHPIVQRSQKKFIQKQQRLGREVVVLDIPLLFETGAENRVDYTFVASAPYHIQRRRVLSRPNMTEEKFEAILSAQMSDHEKRIRADFVIPTGLGLAYTHKILKQSLGSIL